MVGSSSPISASSGARLLAETSSEGGFLKSICFSGLDRLESDLADEDEPAARGEVLLDETEDDEVDAFATVDDDDLPLVLDLDEEVAFFGDLADGITIPKASAKLVPIELSISSISSPESSAAASSFGFLPATTWSVAGASLPVFFDDDEECFEDSCFRLSA